MLTSPGGISAMFNGYMDITRGSSDPSDGLFSHPLRLKFQLILQSQMRHPSEKTNGDVWCFCNRNGDDSWVLMVILWWSYGDLMVILCWFLFIMVNHHDLVVMWWGRMSLIKIHTQTDSEDQFLIGKPSVDDSCSIAMLNCRWVAAIFVQLIVGIFMHFFVLSFTVSRWSGLGICACISSKKVKLRVFKLLLHCFSCKLRLQMGWSLVRPINKNSNPLSDLEN